MALLLSRAGLDVVLIDKATFPSETLSTHMFQAEGVRVLADLGLLDKVLATGAPWLQNAELRFNDVLERLEWPTESADSGPSLCVRREVLDAIFIDALHARHIEVHTGMTVVGLLKEGGRIVGVNGDANGRHLTFRSRLVIGADGRLSSVARLAGSRKYNQTVAERLGYWGYFRNVPWSPPATLYIHRWGDEMVVGCPCDNGLFLVSVIPSLDRLGEFRADSEKSYYEHLSLCDPIRRLVEADGVERVGHLRGMRNPDGFFREATGLGWVLVGDAGHFKDPTPAQGISDALRQAEKLADCVTGSFSGEASLDAALRGWWRWRDRDASGHHYFAEDAGKSGNIPIILAEVIRQLHESNEGLTGFLAVMTHRKKPSQLTTPLCLARALISLAYRQKVPLRVLGREVRIMTRSEIIHRWRVRHPRYASSRKVRRQTNGANVG
jgi:2-polyprenyl-6-methoxyphenol hydroxylase-like FAD-dependent oxidoreductase